VFEQAFWQLFWSAYGPLACIWHWLLMHAYLFWPDGADDFCDVTMTMTTMTTTNMATTMATPTAILDCLPSGCLDATTGLCMAGTGTGTGMCCVAGMFFADWLGCMDCVFINHNQKTLDV
jgi:hypothetical protein